MRSVGTLLSRVRAPPPAPWPDGGPESLRSPSCGLAILKRNKLILCLFPLLPPHLPPPRPLPAPPRRLPSPPRVLRPLVFLSLIALFLLLLGAVAGTVDGESALRSAGSFLSRVRAPPPAPWPGSLRSP
ncbi:hypothetical protein PoB_005016600 [Plakobranchus ocellatus]|uniref:Uncharacterized protein n=1 Tax=Plakobranchus ocellatus TaxID=259542 RepID=A0AAV4BT74_9GAST|nr:hypothetical protein PoB_005016600 [Plakobranchus ocellatus]